MTDLAALRAALQLQWALGQEILALVQREHLALTEPGQRSGSAFEFFRQRLHLLPRLEEAVAALRRHRAAWQQLSPALRRSDPEIGALLRANEDLIFRILLLDRENQQLRLRHGLLTVRAESHPHSNRSTSGQFSTLA
jgi:hypothetical protein